MICVITGSIYRNGYSAMIILLICYAVSKYFTSTVLVFVYYLYELFTTCSVTQRTTLKYSYVPIIGLLCTPLKDPTSTSNPGV